MTLRIRYFYTTLQLLLCVFRYTRFMEMVASAKNGPVPEKLPPTENAAYYHSLRVHEQVLVWKKLDIKAVDPLLWGWQLKDGKFWPIKMDIAPAPENILKFIRCNCKLSSRNVCGTNLCSCRKNSLRCVAACGDCHGNGCQNEEEELVTEENQDSHEHEQNSANGDRNIFELYGVF